jgi:hypothetical protein
MFALCFTSTAAADLRRAQVRTTTRKQTNPALKAVRVGLASLAIVLAAASPSFAGKNGNSGGGNGGGRSGGSSFRVQSNGSNFSQSASKFSTLKVTPKISTNNFNGGGTFSTPKNLTLKNTIKLDTKSNGNYHAAPRFPTITKKIDGLSNVVKKDPPKFDRKIEGLNVLINKDKPVITRKIEGLKDVVNNNGKPTINRKIDGIKDVINKENPLIRHKIPGLAEKLGGKGNGKDDDCHHGKGKDKCHDWDWCWKHHCKPCYKPCHQDWHCYTYPKWCGLHRHTCGYYVNVPVVVVHGIDLQLLAIRFVDNGDAAQNLGPRFRVWIRNNTPTPMLKPFNVLALAARDIVPSTDLPQAGVRIEAMQPGQILPVDIRLPVQANDVNLGMVHVLIDSHREVPEVFEDNNGIVLPRAEVMSVDPALLAADLQTAVPGAEINVAGEGLGAVAGQVIVKLAGLDMAGEVLGWSELGIRIRLPVVQIVNPVDAQIIAVRADGKAILPLPLKVIPGQVQISAQPTGIQPAAAVTTTDEATAVQAMFGG